MPRSAFSLVEALLATTILAIVAAAAALPFAAGTQQIQEAAEFEHAVALGEALMEEILARPFFEYGDWGVPPGPGVADSSRDIFSNVADFHGLDESVAGLKNYQEQDITDATASGLWRQASVEYMRLPDQAPDDQNAFALVEVRVYQDGDLIVTLSRLVGRED